MAVDNKTIKINPEGDLIVDVDALTDDNLIDIQDNKFKINLKRLLWAIVNLPSNDIPATDFDVDFTGLRASTLRGMEFTSNSIGDYRHLTALRHISGPEVVSVGDRAFEKVNLTSIDLPKVKTIGESAFTHGKLTSINLPEVETIKDAAFYGNTITSAYLPRLKTLGQNAFFSNDSTAGHVDHILIHVATPFSAFSQIARHLNYNSATWYVEPENVEKAKGIVGEYNTQNRTNITVKSFAEFPHAQA